MANEISLQHTNDDFTEEQELYEHHRIIVDEGQGLMRIDKFLVNRIENISRNRIQMAAKADCILVNEKPVKANYKIKPCDVVSIVLPHPPREVELIAQDIPINIVYEDDDIIVVNKQPGMVVHPGFGNYSGTLVNALLFHLNNLPKTQDDDIRPGLVHRIDKNTSGILVIAKNELALTRLAKMFFNHDIHRIYNALVWGDVEQNQGTITGHIGRDLKNRKVMTVFEDGSSGKEATSHYTVLKQMNYVTLVECKLETGRTHQIRAHFKHIGHPLFNDAEYGGNKILKGTTFNKYKQFVDNCFEICPRQALHAKYLAFNHPITKKFIEFNSNLPDDMLQLINKWENYIQK